MCLYFNLGVLSIPSYGFMITLGIILANLIAVIYIIKQYNLDFNDFLILEGYCILGGFIGAKLLYLLVSFKEIEWSKILDITYFNSIIQGGFVFYGGLLFGLLSAFLVKKIHKINLELYVRHCIFLIPFIHAFGRIGCYLAGCCYGIPYNGLFAVTFPEGSLAPVGIPLFPVQLVEAILLFLITIIILYLDRRKYILNPVIFYLGSYGILRFTLEYFRYDEYRGHILLFSTSQWISVFIVTVSFVLYIYYRRKSKVYTT